MKKYHQYKTIKQLCNAFAKQHYHGAATGIVPGDVNEIVILEDVAPGYRKKPLGNMSPTSTELISVGKTHIIRTLCL